MLHDFIRTDSLRNVETNAETDVSSYTLWIVAFSISMVIHIVFISATLISRRYDIIKYSYLYN